MILPDTSVWVSYLREGRDGRAAALDELLDTGEVVTCGPVVAELLAGVRRPDRPRLWSLLRALPWARLEPERWREVGELAALLREAGQTVPLTEVEIAVAALEAQAVLWTWDSDFSRIAEVSDLRVGAP